jgi:hypothetical protein
MHYGIQPHCALYKLARRAPVVKIISGCRSKYAPHAENGKNASCGSSPVKKNHPKRKYLKITPE